MYLLGIAILLSLIYIALKPLSDGLLDTSMLVARSGVPEDFDEDPSIQLLVKTRQAALMEGWPSNIPVIAITAMLSSATTAYFYHWWVTPIIVVISFVIAVLVKLRRGGSVRYYLVVLFKRMANRSADYKRDNDLERFFACESMVHELKEMLEIYWDAPIRPPSPKQVKTIPFGDKYYWLEQSAGGT